MSLRRLTLTTLFAVLVAATAGPASAQSATVAMPRQSAFAYAAMPTVAAFSFKDVTDWFNSGGKTMYPLAFLSIMGLAFVLDRAFNLRQGRIMPEGLAVQAKELWKDGKYRDIRALCGEDVEGADPAIVPRKPSALGRLICFIVKHRGNPLSEIDAVIGDLGSREMEPHFRRAYPLAVVATLAPLLGLFGTVTGMIGAFEDFKLLAESGDPSVFAGNIAIALITTEAGLGIAIPTLGFFYFFKNRATKIRSKLEDEVTELMSAWLLKAEKD